MRQLSNALLAELFGQDSNDPFLTLLTITHPSFSTIRLVNNTVDIVSRGNTFVAFPFRLILPPDDGETQRDFQLEVDNTTLELMSQIRSVTTPMEVDIEMILASDPDTVQMSAVTLKTRSAGYSNSSLKIPLYLDNFLNTELPSEKYEPTNFPGIFT